VTINKEPSAFGPVEAVAAEHVVAHWLSEQGGSPALHGGRRKGHDIVDGKQLIDAKLPGPASASEKKREGCTHKPGQQSRPVIGSRGSKAAGVATSIVPASVAA
jgi:hypothetical protein